MEEHRGLASIRSETSARLFLPAPPHVWAQLARCSATIMAVWLAADGLAYKTAERCREARDTSKAALSLTLLLTSGVEPLLTLTLTL